LHLSEHTVRNYLFRIFNKLGVSTRLELALYAINQRERDTHVSSAND
jgi:DNA-binding NarL/FixJ family response regulator